MSVQKGDVVRFKVGYIKGLRARVTAVSPVTGGLTTEMLESRGAYAIGDKVNCEPHEVEKVMT
jgi:ribosomal protein L24